MFFQCGLEGSLTLLLSILTLILNLPFLLNGNKRYASGTIIDFASQIANFRSLSLQALVFRFEQTFCLNLTRALTSLFTKIESAMNEPYGPIRPSNDILNFYEF